jgi:hypothetical protein
MCCGAYLRRCYSHPIDPSTDDFVKLGLPCGPKARVVLMHLNAQAIKTQSATIEVEDSLTAFVKRIGLAGHGRDIRTVKDQLSRLSAATIRLAVTKEEQAFQVNTQIVTAFDLWLTKDERQRVLWPSTVRLSEEYFQNLAKTLFPSMNAPSPPYRIRQWDWIFTHGWHSAFTSSNTGNHSLFRGKRSRINSAGDTRG